MSYILDALKKSDRSRQLNTTHSIQIQSEQTESHKRWKWPVLISALLVFIAIVFFANQKGWFDRSDSPASNIVASGSGETKSERIDDDEENVLEQAPVSLNTIAQPQKERQIEQAAPKVQSTPVVPTPTKEQNNEPRRSLQSFVVSPVDEKKAGLLKTVPEPETQKIDPETNNVVEQEILVSYPNYRNVRSSLSGLGEMHLDILAYHTDVDERRAYINMQKYYEGDETAEGGTIQEIRSDGVVMRYRGKEFILTAK